MQKAAGDRGWGNPHLGARGQLHLPCWAHFPAPCTRPPGLARPRARSARSLPWSSSLSTNGGTARLRERSATSQGLWPRARTRASPPAVLALRPARERAEGERDWHWSACLVARASPHRAGPRWSRPLSFARENQAGAARASELRVPGPIESCSANLSVLKAEFQECLAETRSLLALLLGRGVVCAPPKQWLPSSVQNQIF